MVGGLSVKTLLKGTIFFCKLPWPSSKKTIKQQVVPKVWLTSIRLYSEDIIVWWKTIWNIIVYTQIVSNFLPFVRDGRKRKCMCSDKTEADLTQRVCPQGLNLLTKIDLKCEINTIFLKSLILRSKMWDFAKQGIKPQAEGDCMVFVFKYPLL